MDWFSKSDSTRHNASNSLTQFAARACQREAIKVRPFEIADYALLPAFNWDVTSCEEFAALHRIDEDVSLLHVAVVLETSSLVYRVKTLFPTPPSILESRDDVMGAFSVSFLQDAKGCWKSDCQTELGKIISSFLSKDLALTSMLVSSGHSNVNAWLESIEPVSYMAVNTGMRYSSVSDTTDFIRLSSVIANRIRAYPG